MTLDPREQFFSVSDADYRRALRRAVRDALEEDLGTGDVTTAALGVKDKIGSATLLAKADGLLAGADVFEAVFRTLDPRCSLNWQSSDGTSFKPGTLIVTVKGNAAAILSAERTALNFISHLSGIATVTAHMVQLIEGEKARLLDTRKTMPGLRLLEKRATALGGAVNHRIGLFDALMIKDNHMAAAGGLEQAIKAAMRSRGEQRLICEVRSLEEVQLALDLGITWLLLDNFDLRALGGAVRQVRAWETAHDHAVIAEASGGITPGNITAVARLGVDFISSGHITHSAPSIDFSLEWTGPPATERRVAQ